MAVEFDRGVVPTPHIVTVHFDTHLSYRFAEADARLGCAVLRLTVETAIPSPFDFKPILVRADLDAGVDHRTSRPAAQLQHSISVSRCSPSVHPCTRREFCWFVLTERVGEQMTKYS